MNYPIWDLQYIGGGTFIAVIAILHVFISHLAVGGGAFLWLTDLQATRKNDNALLDYVRRHTWFFLLLTMVFGGVSGVGIWFIIALVSPAATSSLIHAFVFAWAIEWVFFVGEIVALLLYHYRFDKMPQINRQRIAFFYFLFAWLSLFVINGILSFMLTPGAWLESGNFWHGFLNPTLFPSLFFRTFIAASFAGLFGYVTAVYSRDADFRLRLMRYCSRWLLWPLPGILLSGLWYLYALPSSTLTSTFTQNAQSDVFILMLFAMLALLVAAGVLLAGRLPLAWQRRLLFVFIPAGLVWIGSFEYTREIARKPFIIADYMYSTSVRVGTQAQLDSDGFLAQARWTQIKSITADNHLAAGAELFRLQCLSCHTNGGIRNDIRTHVDGFTTTGIEALLSGQGKLRAYMPPFMGTAAERTALASYLGSLTPVRSGPQNKNNRVDAPTDITTFSAGQSEYVLLAWNDLGMHFTLEAFSRLSLLPPGNNFRALLLRRGETPELISEDVTITYAVDPGFLPPAHESDFWRYSKKLYGREIEANTGLSGAGLSGEMSWDDDYSMWRCDGVPVMPYHEDGYNPFPLVTVRAIAADGSELISTRFVAPVTTRIGCTNCHVGDQAGDPIGAAENILALHDQREGTDLLAPAMQGEPVNCYRCHENPLVPVRGDSGVLNMSTSIHAWHANFMPATGQDACLLCHPAPRIQGKQVARGLHSAVGLTCVNCHGEMSEHSMALLQGEGDKAKATTLRKAITSPAYAYDDVDPRMPWTQLPHCLSCHEEYEEPEVDASGFNQWVEEDELYRNAGGYAEVRCQACHGATHALYPARNPRSKHLDNIQPMQYLGRPLPLGAEGSCSVCHIVAIEDAVHHENMEHPFRNVHILKYFED
jgi:hypothetical protein